MTPKEKAQELIDKFMNCEINYLEHAWVCPKGAKNLALIAVDEIIANIEPSVSMDVIEARVNYWQEVKEEIEKL